MLPVMPRPSLDLYGTLADPIRRAILDRLRRGPRPVNQLAQDFPVSRPAISRHLRVLRQARLVRERRDGRHRYYTLEPAPLGELDNWLESYRALLTSSLNRLKQHVEARPDKKEER